MIDLLLGVDGTGVEDHEEYSVDFANSCVRELVLIWNSFNDNRSSKESRYTRGPNMMDTSPKTKDLAQWAVTHALSYDRIAKRENRALNIHMAGYSRGGAAVILACNELKKAGVKVEALLLYDAVDRSLVEGVDVVPDNVRYAFHAMRHPNTQSRPEFDNCGKDAQDRKKTTWVQNRSFRCTHGGMGGVPWIPPEEPLGRTWQDSTSQVVAGVMAGPLGGVAVDYHFYQLQENRRKGLIIESRPSVVPDNPTTVSYKDDLVESVRVRHWMKLQWKMRKTLTGGVFQD